jgi:membrane-bound serine protease (ClpP class)
MLTWGLVLLGVSLFLLLIELLVVSGGAIAVLAVLTATGGIYCLFRFDTTWGLLGTATALFIGPLAMLYGLSIWRHTPIGRRIIGAPPQSSEDDAPSGPKADPRQGLIGLQGRAVTDLRPVGVVEVNGERHDATCESGFLPAGSAVRVTEIEPSQLRVRAVA